MVILCIDRSHQSPNHKPFHEFQNPFKIFSKPHLLLWALLFLKLFHQCLLFSFILFFFSSQDFNLLSCLGTSSSFILTRARIEMFVGGRSTKIISWWWCDQLKKKGNDYGSSCQHNLKTDEYKKSFACSWSHFYYGYLSMDHHKIVCLALILLSREKISRSQCQ